MAMSHMATLSFLLGAASFIVGVIAENMKPDSGTPVQGKDVIICNYSSASHQYMALGFVSLGLLVSSAFVGYFSLSRPYNKRAIPSSALYASATMRVFFYIALVQHTGYGQHWERHLSCGQHSQSFCTGKIMSTRTCNTSVPLLRRAFWEAGRCCPCLQASFGLCASCWPKTQETTTLRRLRSHVKGREPRSSISTIMIFCFPFEYC